MISYNLFSYLYSYFSENGSLGWDVPPMKQLCTTCVTYKKNGAMESFHFIRAMDDELVSKYFEVHHEYTPR